MQSHYTRCTRKCPPLLAGNMMQQLLNKSPAGSHSLFDCCSDGRGLNKEEGIAPQWPTLPQPCGCSTIGAVLFHFQVRDGAGWVQYALTTEQNLFTSLSPPPIVM